MTENRIHGFCVGQRDTATSLSCPIELVRDAMHSFTRIQTTDKLIYQTPKSYENVSQ